MICLRIKSAKELGLLQNKTTTTNNSGSPRNTLENVKAGDQKASWEVGEYFPPLGTNKRLTLVVPSTVPRRPMAALGASLC